MPKYGCLTAILGRMHILDSIQNSPIEISASDRSLPVTAAIGEPTDRPLLAESGPSFHVISSSLNVRFREKRIFAMHKIFLHK
jgi:hypothetical protein